MLLAYLSAQRDHVLGILEGLSDEDLRRPVLPSGWSCVGLVQHLSLDVERFWFREIVAGETIDSDESTEITSSAWQTPPTVLVDTVFERYGDEIARANVVISATSLAAPPAYWPEYRWPTWRLQNLRQTILHVITETACHAGHLDAALLM